MAIRWSFQSGLGALANHLDKVAAERELEIAELLRDHIVAQMQATKSGLTYKVPGTSITYTASAAGEYPAVRTGRLLQTIQAMSRGGQAAVGTDHPSAAEIERLRPFIALAVVERAHEIREITGRPWI